LVARRIAKTRHRVPGLRSRRSFPRNFGRESRRLLRTQPLPRKNRDEERDREGKILEHGHRPQDVQYPNQHHLRVQLSAASVATVKSSDATSAASMRITVGRV